MEVVGIIIGGVVLAALVKRRAERHDQAGTVVRVNVVDPAKRAHAPYGVRRTRVHGRRL